jgi:microcin C transport system substrate-binding protein
MKRPAAIFAACVLALGAVIVSGCKKGEGYKAYDNSSERESFYKRFNTETSVRLAGELKELEASLAGDLSEQARKEKAQALADLKRRLERPDFFEFFAEDQLPQDLQWQAAEDGPEIGSPEAKKGGTLHSYIVGNAFPPTLRTLGAEGNNSFRHYHWDDMEMSLVHLHPETGKLMPALADRWAVDADGQTIYYHIDTSARWSDGKDVTARDWLMTFYIYLSEYLSETHYREYVKGQYWGVATYGDDYLCLRIATPKPLAPYVASTYPFQEDFYKEFGPDFEARYNWRCRPTTGAYEIRPEGVKKGRSITMSRVQDWWARERKYYKHRFNPDQMVYNLVRDDEKVFQMVLNGDIEVYWLMDARKWFEQSEVPQVFNGYIEKARYYFEFPAISSGLYLNQHSPLLAIQDVRIGLQHASNWEKVIEFDLRGEGERLHILEAGYGQYSHPTLKTRPFSVEKAREAFGRAGFTELGPDGILKDKDGRRLSFTITYAKRPTYDAWLLRLKEEAKKAGVEFKLEGMDSTAAFGKIQRKEHEIAMMGWQGQLPFPDFYQGFHSSEAYEPGTNKPKPMSNNISSFADPALDPLIEENRAARSEEVVRETTWKLEEILHERAVWVPAFDRPFYRVLYWRWIRWPDDFNVRMGNDPEMNYVLWIDQDMKKDTLQAMKEGRIFPEKSVVYDQHRRKAAAEN